MLYQSLVNADVPHTHLKESFLVNFEDGSIAGCDSLEAIKTLLAAEHRVLSYYRAFTTVVQSYILLSLVDVDFNYTLHDNIDVCTDLARQ